MLRVQIVLANTIMDMYDFTVIKDHKCYIENYFNTISINTLIQRFYCPQHRRVLGKYH